MSPDLCFSAITSAPGQASKCKKVIISSRLDTRACAAWKRMVLNWKTDCLMILKSMGKYSQGFMVRMRSLILCNLPGWWFCWFLFVFFRMFAVFQRFGAKSGNGLKCNKKGPRSNSRATILVAGAGFEPAAFRLWDWRNFELEAYLSGFKLLMLFLLVVLLVFSLDFVPYVAVCF